MESPVAQSASRPSFIDISSLSPEILLSILLRLDSQEIVIFRRVCKKWLEVIDNNKPLWRNLEWIGKSKESIEKAVEVFDQKSSSSLEMVSIEEGGAFYYSKDLQQVVSVVSQSSANLKSLSILTFLPHLIVGPLLELAISSPNLEKLVLWDARESYKMSLPSIHPVFNRNRVDAGSSASPLKVVLWLFAVSNKDSKQILDLPNHSVNSLISFALYGARYFQTWRPFLAKFSDTIVHLCLTISGGTSQVIQPLFCPNLKIFEGNSQPDVSLYFDCPNLKHLILFFESRTRLHGIPSSVEQLWLKSDGRDVTVEVWEPLLSSCPNIKVLRLKRAEPGIEAKGGANLRLENLIQVLQKRQEMINKGEKIQGLHVAPLQELVLPLEILSKSEINKALKVGKELIDIQDYPDFVELEH